MSYTQSKLYGDYTLISSHYAKEGDTLYPGTVFEVNLDAQLTDKSSMVLSKAIIPYSYDLIHDTHNGYDANNKLIMTLGFDNDNGENGHVIVGLTGGSITSSQILNAGINYTSPPQLLVGSGTGAFASAQINNSGGVDTLTATSLGNSYTSEPGIEPIVVIGGGTGGDVQANAPHLGVIQSAVVTNGGQDYYMKPNIVVTDHNTGQDFECEVSITGGILLTVTIINGGTGYTQAPTLEVQSVGGDGYGATATAHVNHLGQITYYTVTDPGQNYTYGPLVSILSPGHGGTGAVLSCTILNGSIDIITIENGGSGYFDVPNVVVRPGHLVTKELTFPDGNYILDPYVDNTSLQVDKDKNINTQLSHLIENAFAGEFGNAISSEIVYSSLKNKLKFNISLFGDTTSNNTYKFYYRGGQDMRLFKMLGFPIGSDFDGAYGLESSNKCEVSGPDVLLIRTNLTLKYDIAGRRVNDCFIIPVNVNPGGVITYEGSRDENQIELEYSRTEIAKIDIAIEFLDTGLPVGGGKGLQSGESIFEFRWF